jgi:hypothetical protein
MCGRQGSAACPKDAPMPTFSLSTILWIAVIVVGVFAAYKLMGGSQADKEERADVYLALALGLLLLVGIVGGVAAFFGYSIFPGLR